LDGHSSYICNFEVINSGRKNHVFFISLQPHSTHRMQPLDLAFMGPLKCCYAQDIERWLRAHAGRVVTIYQPGELRRIWKRRHEAATAENAASGFRKLGHYPCTNNIFRPQRLSSCRERLGANFY
jgi:hypothetical protein